jgi:tRNA (cmo5U34)-methyltransferase
MAIDAQLPVLTPQQDETILRISGFSNVSPFYGGFAFIDWVD